MAKPYRVTAFVRINNAITASLMRLGIPMGSFALLTVRGRKSGKPITTPIALFLQDGNRYLIATYGLVNWVRNIRAASGAATITHDSHKEQVQAVEMEPAAAAPIIRDALRAGPPGIPAPMVRMYRRYMVLPYLNVTMHSSLPEFEQEARTHPVFLIHSAT